MKTRLFAAVLALALPLCAQDASAETEAVFYKAFYLEKGARDFAGAMNLYSKFLTKRMILEGITSLEEVLRVSRED